MSTSYARFECRICGEQVYSPLTSEQYVDVISKEKVTELTCSGGHSDLYKPHEINLVEGRPAGRLQMRRAMADGG
jgi:hypothetical protein